METYTSVISPDSSACGRAVKLNAIDQIAPRCYMTSFMFFQMSPETDIHKTHKEIQTALCHTLTEIPQLMTTIRVCCSHREELELAYDSERGSLLTFKDYVTTPERRAAWPHGSYEELEAQHFPYSACERHLVLGQIPEWDDGSSPALSIQMNYIPGGALMAVQLSHTVCDGTGNYLFYQTFAKHCAQVDRGESFTSGPAISFFERAHVVDPEHDVHIDEFPNWKAVDSNGGWHDPITYNAEDWPKIHHGVFFIDEARMRKLQKRLTSATYRPSAIESLGAFLWQQVVQARNIDADKYPEAKLSITVDTRKRMTMPAVPGNFWGNLCEPNAVARMPTRSLLQPMINDTRVSSPVGQAAQTVTALQESLSHAARDVVDSAQEKLQEAARNAQETLQEAARNAQEKLQEAARSAQEKLNEAAQAAKEKFPEAAKAALSVNEAWNANLGEATRRIRQALMAVDNTAVRRLVGLLNQMPKSTSLTWNVDRWPGPDMLIVCINFHHYYHMNFGSKLGSINGMRFSVGDTEGRPDGRCLFMPPKVNDGRGMEIVLQYDVDTLRRLQASEDFMQYFDRRC